VSGATVHFVDEGIDTGPIVLQESVDVRQGDTPETLHARIRAVEHRLLPAAVRLFLDGKLSSPVGAA
jgi:phosphoribosylglycinamide formyltransferase-1